MKSEEVVYNCQTSGRALLTAVESQAGKASFLRDGTYSNKYSTTDGQVVKDRVDRSEGTN